MGFQILLLLKTMFLSLLIQSTTIFVTSFTANSNSQTRKLPRADLVRNVVTGDQEDSCIKNRRDEMSEDYTKTRRNIMGNFLFTSSSVALSLTSFPLLSSAEPKEFDTVGKQAPAPDGESPFITLSNGVKIKDLKLGTGDDSVTATSRVSVQCNGRLLNLNGNPFYNTKNNNPDGFGAIPLTVTFGKGEALPGFESGIIGMKKTGIRRIIVPSELAYSKYPDLEPKPTTALDQRALESVTKNPRRDATIMFDVKVERFNK